MRKTNKVKNSFGSFFHFFVSPRYYNYAIVATVGAEPLLRKSFSIEDKKEFVQAINATVATGVSRRQACSRLGLPHVYCTRFEKVIAKVDALENGDAFIPHNINSTARKIHSGAPSLLSVIKDDLARFIFEARQRGIQVSIHLIRQEACCLLPNFRSKSL